MLFRDVKVIDKNDLSYHINRGTVSSSLDHGEDGENVEPIFIIKNAFPSTNVDQDADENIRDDQSSRSRGSLKIIRTDRTGRVRKQY